MNTLINCSSLTQVDPRVLPHLEDCSDDSALSEEEIIQQAREQPEALNDLLIPFHALEDEGVRKISRILGRLRLENRAEVKIAIPLAIMLFPPKLRRDFLKNQPDSLIDSFAELDDTQRQSLVSEVIRVKERGWKKLFIRIFELIKREEEGGKGRERAAHFLNRLLPAFEPDAKSEWLLYYTESMSDYGSWPFLIVSLKTEEQELVLSYLEKSLVCDLSEGGYFSCLSQLTSEKEHHPAEVRSIIRQIFNHFLREGKFTVILNSFSTLSYEMQACFLDSMRTVDLRVVLNENPEPSSTLINWLNKLFYYKENFKAKRQVFAEFVPFLAEYENSVILETLNDLQSPWGAHFLAFGGSDLPNEIANLASLDARSTFLHNCKFSITTRKVLNALYHSKKIESYELICFDLNNPAIDLDMRSHNLSTVLDYLAVIEPECLEICKPLIDRIPSFIIGLSSFDRKKRGEVMRLLPFMNDEQLKFFVCTLPKEELECVIRQYGAKLEVTSLLAILEALSPKQLCSFLEIRVEELKLYREDFRNRYRALVSEFDIIKRNRSITSEKLDELQQKVNLLQVIAEKPNYLMFNSLSKFFKKIDRRYCHQQLISRPVQKQLNALMSQFKKECGDLLSKTPMFRVGGVISAEIDQIKEYAPDPEVDLTERLYLGFWLLARECTLPYLGISPHSSLGITNLGELTSLGIHSNKDLDYIGISPEWEENIQAGIEKLEALSSIFSNNPTSIASESLSKKRKLSEIRPLWETLSRIELESEEGALAISRQLVDLLKIPDQIPTQGLQGCIAFFISLSKLRFIKDSDLYFIRKTVRSLRRSRIDGPRLKESFCKGLLLLREQQPLFCLKHYLLRNESLKTTWEQLRTHGYNSIEDLYNSKLIKKPRDLMRLHTLEVPTPPR